MTKRITSLLAIIVLVISTTYSQNQQKIDSLVILSHTAPVDTNLVDTYEQITKLYLRIQLDSAQVYAQKMIELSEELSYDKGMAMGNNWYGEAALWLGNPEIAIVCFKNTNEIFGKNGKSKMWAHSLQVIANVHATSDNLDSALLLYNEALQYYQDNNDKYSASKALVNIGKVYSQKGDFTTALQNHYKARLTFKELNNDYWFFTTEMAIAVIYGRQLNYDSAIPVYQRIVAHHKEKNDLFYLAEAYTNLGVIYEGNKEYEKALNAQKMSLKYRQQVNDTRGLAITQMNIGSLYLNWEVLDSVMLYLNDSRKILEDIKSMHALAFNLLLTGNYYLKVNNLSKAEDAYLLSHQISIDNNLQDNIKDASKSLSKVYEEMYDYKNALKYAKIYKTQYDSLINKENIRAQTIAEEGYKHNLQLISKETEIEYERQKTNYAIITGSIILLFFVLLFFYWRKLQKTKLLQTEHKNQIMVQKARLQTQKEERKRLANILHDNIAHVITISQNQINSVIKKTDLNESKESLHQVEDNLVLANKMAKVASYELEFSLVLEKNIVNQFQSYINRIQHSHSPKISFHHSDNEQFDNMSDEIKINVFSVFQEMLGNAIKYSQAGSIRVTLLYDEGKIELQVTDNGIGFNYDEVRHGLGFPNMKKRANDLNGTFTFESEKGFGTKLKFVV